MEDCRYFRDYDGGSVTPWKGKKKKKWKDKVPFGTYCQFKYASLIPNILV